MDYNANDRDQIRRAYLQKGPCQRRYHNFLQKSFGQKLWRFNQAWFSEFPNWLEYNVAKDATFCLCCYLFKPDIGDQADGDSFVGEGFSNWKKKEKIRTHVGGPNSAHNQASSKCQDLLNQNQHSQTIFFKQFDQARIEYRTHLNSSIDCVKFLLRQGLEFRGHDEFENSSNQGKFLELLKFLVDHNEDVKVVALSNASQNLKLISPDIKKGIVNVAAFETINVIIRDLGDTLFFSILIDEARDISINEQMTVIIRYVDKKSQVIEHFLGIEHVANTNALSLKQAVENLFSRLRLSISKLQGQGYDGGRNMQGEFNGLKTLILKENPCAYYVYCFAHQLQLALLTVAKNRNQIALLFTLVSNVVNVVEASCKRRDIVREKQAAKVAEALNTEELSSGQGLNQETTLKRAGDTRWGSHYGTLVSLASMFSTVIDMLEMISENGSNSKQRAEANVLLDSIQSFEFVFNLHLMKTILAITSELSQALQRKYQDIVNAMNLVQNFKVRLQKMRESGWTSLLDDSLSFCEKHEINVPQMEDMFVAQGRQMCNAREITNLNYYRAELFYTVLDMQIQELNARFTESNTELLLCVACLNPSNSFSSFDVVLSS
ncbi:zinc finger MYM-type protein 1-like [Camellia sinensis]|uniref:zinc finger MYM-type protein 1-like n=1 Tax=Camellia sinensis TaxID=4442 RepID=UPI00103633EA|nr:zinc finger MYM-type protein 1-like [Camellia sinensis]